MGKKLVPYLSVSLCSNANFFVHVCLKMVQHLGLFRRETVASGAPGGADVKAIKFLGYRYIHDIMSVEKIRTRTVYDFETFN